MKRIAWGSFAVGVVAVLLVQYFLGKRRAAA